MPGFTNIGKRRTLEWAYGKVAIPSDLYFHLITDAVAPTQDDVLASGYTAASNQGTPPSTPMDGTDIDVSGSDNTDDWGRIQFIDKVWTASGGSCTARYVILANNTTFGSITEVYAYWNLGANKTFLTGQTLTVKDLELRLTQT